jgi:hypothetical protein
LYLAYYWDYVVKCLCKARFINEFVRLDDEIRTGAPESKRRAMLPSVLGDADTNKIP